jgi:hypothetical protein
MNSVGNGFPFLISTTAPSTSAYAFGQLLVLSLYQQFKAEESFKPRYLESYLRAARMLR